MPKPRRSAPTVPFTTQLPPDLYEALASHATRTGTPQKAIVVAALRNFFGATEPTKDTTP